MTGRPCYYFTRVVPAYRRPILERLNERLDGRLVVCAGEPPRSSSLRSLRSRDASKYVQVHLRNIWFLGERLHIQPFHRAFRAFGPPSVILAEESPRSLSLPILLDYARRKSIGTVLWGHFSSNDRSFSTSNLFDRYRLSLARKADACVCYTHSIADLLRPHVASERLFVAPNTLDTHLLFELHDRLVREGKQPVRARLNLPPDVPIVAFIGRLTREKNATLLLEVFRRFSIRQAAHLLIIGDGPERGLLEQRVAIEGLRNVHFLGALSSQDSAPFLFAADVMMIPGRLGLSVNHAFAFGLPVVAQAPPPGIRFHGPEAEFIKNGENGVLAAHGRPDALLEGLLHVLRDRERFSRNAWTYARDHLTIDRMIDGLEAAVRSVEGRT